MILGQKVGYAQVITNTQNLTFNVNDLRTVIAFLKKKSRVAKELPGQHLIMPWLTFALVMYSLLPSLIALPVLFTT